MFVGRGMVELQEEGTVIAWCSVIFLLDVTNDAGMASRYEEVVELMPGSVAGICPRFVPVGVGEETGHSSEVKGVHEVADLFATVV